MLLIFILFFHSMVHNSFAYSRKNINHNQPVKLFNLGMNLCSICHVKVLPSLTFRPVEAMDYSAKPETKASECAWDKRTFRRKIHSKYVKSLEHKHGTKYRKKKLRKMVEISWHATSNEKTTILYKKGLLFLIKGTCAITRGVRNLIPVTGGNIYSLRITYMDHLVLSDNMAPATNLLLGICIYKQKLRI